MSPQLRRPVLLAVSVVLTWTIAYALEVPSLRGRVNDLAGLLSQEQSGRLEDQLAQFEQETGHQLVVLIVPTLESEDIASFTLKTAERWKLGQKGHDNWALLFIAMNDRKLRIEVGYGLEGTLPDVTAHRIIDEIMVPRFREKDFSDGIEAGITAIIKASQGEPIPESARTRSNSKNASPSGILSLLIAVALIALIVGVTQPSAVGAAVRGAVVSGVIGLPGKFAVGTWAWLSAILIGAFASAIASIFAQRAWGRAWTVRASRRSDYSPRDTFHTGYVGGGSSGDYGGGGSAGSSGGGFAGGGGGGGGGGGASGGW